MNINIERKKSAAARMPIDVSSPLDGRVGFYAAVTELHPENSTVHVVTDTGIELANIKVASFEWVTYKKDGKPSLTGERNLPPVGTYVFCLSPTGRHEESFVLCSLFSDSPLHADYMEEGDDAASTKKVVENGGWESTTDYRTGTKAIKNKADGESISIEIDQETEGDEKATLKIHGTTFKVTKKGVEVETDAESTVKVGKDSKIVVDGNASIDVKKDAKVSAKNVNITGSVKTEIHGGQVKIGGTVTPTGNGAMCALPFCAFTGAPQCGDTALNA